MNRLLLATALLASVSCGSTAGPAPEAATMSAEGKGAELFNANCALCHGRKGDLGMNGAKDLGLSTLTRAEMIAAAFSVLDDARFDQHPQLEGPTSFKRRQVFS